jgi:hypothetical protein
MSTCKIEVEEAKQAEEAEDEPSPAESRLARKLASFGMAAHRHYTSRRIQSEEQLLPVPEDSHARMSPRGETPMGKLYPAIDDSVRQFLEAQPVFFVGSAPLDPRGHVNVSPKGLDTFRILGPSTIAYLDLTGSGIETVSHLKENGRIVLMFCNFQGPPRILRLYGRGRVIEQGHPEFVSLATHFPAYQGTRAIVLVELSRIADSCGFGVPLLKLEGQRTQLTAWAQKLGPEALRKYRHEKNEQNIDGMPGLEKQT